jgi:hypothetical protein
MALVAVDSARGQGFNKGPGGGGTGRNTAGGGGGGQNTPGKPTPTPAPTPPTILQRLHFANPALRPDDPADRTSNLAVGRAMDRLSIPQATPAPAVEPGKDVKEMKEVKDMTAPACDGWFCSPSIFTEYDFVTSADTRQFGSDSHTNAFSIGGDFFTKGNILAGVIYTFNDQSDHASFIQRRADEVTNLVSLYLARSIGNWVNVGVAGGYGHTGVNETLAGSGGLSTGFANNFWDIAPFIGVAHSWGAFSASLTTTYLQEWDRISAAEFTRGYQSHTGKFEFTFRLGYAVTDRLKVEAYSSYYQAVEAPPALFYLPEDHNWWAFGTKISYQLAQPCQIYVGYEYDGFDESYVDHTVKAGLNFAF